MKLNPEISYTFVVFSSDLLYLSLDNPYDLSFSSISRRFIDGEAIEKENEDNTIVQRTTAPEQKLVFSTGAKSWWLSFYWLAFHPASKSSKHSTKSRKDIAVEGKKICAGLEQGFSGKSWVYNEVKEKNANKIRNLMKYRAEKSKFLIASQLWNLK